MTCFHAFHESVCVKMMGNNFWGNQTEIKQKRTERTGRIGQEPDPSGKSADACPSQGVKQLLFTGVAPDDFGGASVLPTGVPVGGL